MLFPELSVTCLRMKLHTQPATSPRPPTPPTPQPTHTPPTHNAQLNDTLSLGQHRVWKRMAVKWSGAAAGQRVLDVCCGSGDLAMLLGEAVGPSGQVRACAFPPSFCVSMLPPGFHHVLTGLEGPPHPTSTSQPQSTRVARLDYAAPMLCPTLLST